MLRKAAWAAAGIIPTLIAANHMPRFVLYGFSAAIFLATVILFFFRRKGRLTRTFFLFGAASLGLCSFLIHYQTINPSLHLYDQQTIQADVIFVEGESNYWMVQIEDATSGGETLKIRDTITVSVYDHIIEKYDRGTIEFTVVADPDTGQYIPSDVKVLCVSHPLTKSLVQRLDEFRQQVVTLLQIHIGGEEGTLAAAFLTGDKTDLSRQTTVNFNRTGLTHVMAVSGLHLSILIGMISYLLSRIDANRKIISAISLLFVGLVVVLGGFSTSVLRAGIMSAVMFIGHLINRRSDPINSLGLALVIIALIFPGDVVTPSYLLSGAATAGILILAPILDDKLFGRFAVTHAQRQQLSLISVSLSSSIFTAPILIIFFRELSVLSVPAMSLVNYPVTAVLIGSVLLCCLSWIPFLGDFIAFIIRLVARLILDTVELLAQFEQATISFHSIPMIVFAVLCLLLSLNVWLLHKKIKVRRLVSVCLLLFMVLSLGGAEIYHYTFSKLIVLSQGTGSCSVYIDDGKSIVVDCANAALANDAQEILKQHGFDHIDLLLVTGLDARLISGVPTLLTYIPAKQVVISGNERYNEYLSRVTDAANAVGADVMLFSKDAVISLERHTIELYDLGDHDNNFSIIVDHSIGFFPSLDDKIIAKSVFLPHGKLHIDTLITGTCAEKGSIKSTFLYATKPQTVIVLVSDRREKALTLSETNAIISTGAALHILGDNETHMINYHQIG